MATQEIENARNLMIYRVPTKRDTPGKIRYTKRKAQEKADTTGCKVILQIESEYPFVHISWNPCYLWWKSAGFWEFYPTPR